MTGWRSTSRHSIQLLKSFLLILNLPLIYYLKELQIAGVNFKAFDLGGHEIARRIWKEYYAKVYLILILIII